MNRTAILAFSRRTDCLTGPAKVIDGDTIVVARQLHGIDATELDQMFWWRGPHVTHDVVGRPQGPHSRGQGALRGGRA
jgi:endonuclease YncB( thermonuclease family)